MADSPGVLAPIVFFLCFHLVTSAAFLFDSNGIVRPKNPYGFIREKLILTCNVTDLQITGNVSGSMFFSRQSEEGERIIPPKYIRILSTRSIRLEYPVRSGEQQGSYVCHLNTSDSDTILGSQYVTVDYRPEPVNKVDCHVYNWETMTCNWSLGLDYVNKDLVKVQLVWTIMGTQYDCPYQTLTSCSWKNRDERNTFLPGQFYYMSVIVMTHDKNKKKVAEAQSKVFTINTRLIVKPAPVVDLRVVSKNSTCLSIAWHHQKKYRGILYRLHLWQGKHLQEYNSISEKQTTVCGLHPARDYVIQVSGIPIPMDSEEPQGTYSDWSSIVEHTLEDVPSDVPGLSIGSFVYRNCPVDGVLCTVTVYWKPIPEEFANGEITNYSVHLTDTEFGNDFKQEVKGTAREIDLEVKQDQEYLVQLRGRTRVGYSVNAAAILIRAYQYRVNPPSKFVVEAHGTTLFISWEPPIETQDSPHGLDKGYTLYYCNGSKTTMYCQDGIQWRHFSTRQKSFQWEVPDGNLDIKLVGISAEKKVANQNVSSGILWNKCIYLKDKKPSAPVNVQFSPEQPDNGLRLEWEKLSCAIHSVYITHYIVSYCRANRQGGCAGPTVNESVQNTAMNHMIKDLTTGVSYRVTLRAVSQAGQGPESVPLVKLVVNSDLNTGEMIGVVFACLFVFILVIIFIILCFKKVRKIKKDFYMHVDIPSLPPLREADSMRDGSHHYLGRPLPQIPQVTPRTVTGPDDGYSSADTDPSFDPGRYEPVVKPRNNGKNNGKNNGNNETTKRNVSETSETLLLPHMEEDHLKCHPYQVTQLSRVQDPGVAGKSYKKHRSKPYYKKADPASRGCSSGLGGSSIDSYLRVDVDEDLQDPQNISATSGHSRRPLLDFNSIPQTKGRFHSVPIHEPQFVVNPPPPSEPPPSPAPAGDCTDLTLRVSDSPNSDNASYISGITQLVRPYLLNGSMDASHLSMPGQYAAPVSEGSSSSQFGYVSHDQAMISGQPVAMAMTSSPESPQAMMRPLSEYMKDLPISYFEEPQPDQEQGPTTEL